MFEYNNMPGTGMVYDIVNVTMDVCDKLCMHASLSNSVTVYCSCKRKNRNWVVVHTFNPSSGETEIRGSMIFRSAWSIE